MNYQLTTHFAHESPICTKNSHVRNLRHDWNVRNNIFIPLIVKHYTCDSNNQTMLKSSEKCMSLLLKSWIFAYPHEIRQKIERKFTWNFSKISIQRWCWGQKSSVIKSTTILILLVSSHLVPKHPALPLVLVKPLRNSRRSSNMWLSIVMQWTFNF